MCLCLSIFFFFFFSSRRRHTRWTGDWSSDVCSSDLTERALSGLAASRSSNSERARSVPCRRSRNGETTARRTQRTPGRCGSDTTGGPEVFCEARAKRGRRKRIPRRTQRYAFRTKSSYATILVKVMGKRSRKAYQKIINARGNQGDPRSFLTTDHAEATTAEDMTSQRTNPPMPISKTRLP